MRDLSAVKIERESLSEEILEVIANQRGHITIDRNGQVGILEIVGVSPFTFTFAKCLLNGDVYKHLSWTRHPADRITLSTPEEIEKLNNG